MQLIAKTFQGLEEVLVQELNDLGAQGVQTLTRAAAFEGDLEWLYRANLELRTALRILVPVGSFYCTNENQLYQGIRSIDWRPFLTPQDTLAVDAVVNSTYFTHSHYAALKTKDAIVDQLRDHYGQRPSVDAKNPDLRIHVHIRENRCSVSLDSSGEPLFKRGYRKETGPAPLNEVLAAGMLQLAAWPKEMPFLDPMCGSGTLPIEAAMMASHTPASWFRTRFAFQNWKDYDPVLWHQIRKNAEEKINRQIPPIYGSDSHPGALRMARANAETTGLEHLIQWEQAPLERCPLPVEKGLMVMNPPYDERMPVAEIESLYQSIGSNMKHRFSGFQAWVLSANEKALHAIGLRPSRKISLYNGALPCKFVKFELYEGSKKHKGDS